MGGEKQVLFEHVIATIWTFPMWPVPVESIAQHLGRRNDSQRARVNETIQSLSSQVPILLSSGAVMLDLSRMGFEYITILLLDLNLARCGGIHNALSAIPRGVFKPSTEKGEPLLQMLGGARMTELACCMTRGGITTDAQLIGVVRHREDGLKALRDRIARARGVTGVRDLCKAKILPN